MAKNKVFLGMVFLGSLALIAIVISAITYNHNRYLKSFVPHLVPGERIEYLALTRVDDNVEVKTIDSSFLDPDKISLLFIFKSPCSTCNDNLQFWKRLSKMTANKVNAIGISLNDYSTTLNSGIHKKTNFAMYVAENPGLFRKKFRIKFNMAQTILYYNGRVIETKLGNLKGEDFIHFLNIVKRIIQEVKND